jgi:hypothetical protein
MDSLFRVSHFYCLQLANTEEYIDEKFSGYLGEIQIS